MLSPHESIKDFQPIKFNCGLFETRACKRTRLLCSHVKEKMSDSLAIYFITNYWKQVLGAILPLLVLYLIQRFFSKRQETQDKPVQLPEEHPLAEFRDVRTTEEDSGPLHAEGTEHIPYVHVNRTEEEMIQRSQDFYQLMNSRRSVRMFSSRPVPIEVIKNIVRTAGTSPSGMYHVTMAIVCVNSGTTYYCSQSCCIGLRIK